MMYETVKVYQLISDSYEKIDNLIVACEGKISEIMITELDRRSDGIRKDALDQIIARETSKYRKCIERAQKVKDAMKDLDRSVNGGL